MSLLMFVALAGHLIAYRINQSAVVGIILAGILVGPSLLGLVTYTDFVETLAHLGAVVLLFTIGLEFSIKDIAKVRHFWIALMGILVPAFGGFFLAGLFHFDLKAAIFVGTALTATSIAIAANVLREMGKLQTETARAIIGAAVIGDILALLALSVSEGIVSGDLSAASLFIIATKAVAFVGLGILIGKIVLGRLIAGLDRTKIAAKYPEMPRLDRNFWTDERCSACGLCLRACPARNIAPVEGRPVWAHRCEQCLRCLQWCPKTSIQYGKNTPKYQRYQHPEVHVRDVLMERIDTGESTAEKGP